MLLCIIVIGRYSGTSLASWDRQMDTKPDSELPQQPPSSIERDGGDIQFMLAEFGELCQLFRHTDSRLYSSFNFYLTFVAATITVVVLLLGYISDARFYALATLPFQCAVFLIGYFLAQHMFLSEVLKGEYRQGLNLIRRFFVDKYEHLTPYLVLPLAPPPTARVEELPREKPHSVSRDILAISLINAIVLGTIAGTVSWVINADSHWAVAMAISIGIAVIILASVLFRRSFDRRLRSLWRAARM
jgi:hypothetical protein